MSNARKETQLRSAFGLKCLPFTKDLDATNAYEMPAHVDGLGRLQYLVDRQGIGIVVGMPGTGKSTLLRRFLAELPRTTYCTCYVDHSNCAVLDLYRDIARGFPVEPGYRKADVMRQIKERVTKLSRVQRLRPVLVIDDAHLLPRNILDDLRLLTSFDGDGKDDLTVVLAGHPQLESNLRLAVNEAFAQRVVIRVRLQPLRRDDVDAYIKFRLQHAGRTAALFQPDAVEAIAKGSRGIPRLIDRIAEHSLLIALQKKRKEVDAELVTHAMEEVDS